MSLVETNAEKFTGSYGKACTRNMAAPTNIFGGASIVDVI